MFYDEEFTRFMQNLTHAWTKGTASFGYSVEYSDLSFKKFKSSSCLLQDGEIAKAKFLVQDCWNSFCKNLNDADKSVVEDINCLISCGAMPGSRTGSGMNPECCQFVFGFEIKSIDSLKNLARVRENEKLRDKIAHFLYLFNETDGFAKHYGERARKIKSIKIDTDLTALSDEARKAINELREKVKPPDLLIGCESI